MAFGIRSTGNILTDTAVPEVQTLEFNDIGAADTFKLTFNAHESTAVTYSADMAADITAALVGLSDFASGDVVATKVDTNSYDVTFGGAFAGVNASAITITTQSGFTATGVTETTSGRSQHTAVVSLGSRFAILYGIRWGLFVDGATNELVVTDAAGRVVYSVTGKDTNVSGARLATFIGQDGKDQSGNSLANVGGTLVEGPLTVRVRNGSGTVTPASGSVEFYIRHTVGGHIVERSTGTLTTSGAGAVSQELSLGATLGRVFHIKLDGFDTSTDFAITDVNGANVFTKTALDTDTAAIDFAVGYDGEDQAGNAAADALPGVFRGPLTVAVTNGGASTTGSVTLWAEI
jgi:hypothetical protein